MNADSSPGNSSKMHTSIPGVAVWIFRLLRTFWLTELALLLVALYGLQAGWSIKRQWSDGFFVAALAQIIIAGMTILGSPQELSGASYVRYIANSSISDTFHELLSISLHKQRFGVRAFIGALITLLISGLFLLG